MPVNLYQRSAMAAAIAACFPGAVLAAGVARVDFASGNVSAIAPNGQARALQKGAEIQVGETVATQQGRAQLRFADGAYMSLQPQTEFKVEEFKFSGQPQADDNIVMNLLKGGMRTITGLIGRSNRNAYRLKTDVATIGIRGTEYSVKYTNSIEVFVADGAVAVENQSGSFTVPGGTGVMVSNQSTPPQQTDQKPVLPPESPMQQEQQKQEQKVADPVNPIQDSVPPISDAPLVTPITGTLQGNWAVAHWDWGVEAQLNQTITLNGQGVLTAFGDSYEGGGTNTVGTATASSSGNDGIIAWGRWIGGNVGGNGGYSGLNLDDMFGEGPGSGALHYVVGLPATNLPPVGMMATYSMIGATTPSFSGVSSFSVDSSSIDVYFGTSSAFMNLTVTANGQQLTGSGMGLNLAGAHMSGSGFLSGGTSSACASFAGFLAGAGGVRAGMAYRMNICCDVNGNANGVIVYKQGAVVPGSLPQ